MPGVTVVVLTGAALGRIAAACSVARALQPSMVVVEDVDLIAEQRESRGGQHPLLFQLLNEMDGLGEDADVAFLLTTNRADLLEPALAQRPGRVDHAAELPLPDADARRRLMRLYQLSTVQARDCCILAGHFDVAIDVTWLRRCGLSGPAEAGELAAELQVLAVSLLECGVQGLRLVTVLFLEVADLAGQGLDDRVVAVGVAGRDRLRAGLGAQPLDPAAQVRVPVEEGVGAPGPRAARPGR